MLGLEQKCSSMNEVEALRKYWLSEEVAAFQGWDFSHLDGRMTEETLPWDYRKLIQKHIRPENRLLDIGTGGGEFLLSLNHPRQRTCVTEAYPPNVNLCIERLAPLGITVRQMSDDKLIPYNDEEFDIVLNRHESFDAHEVFRILKPNGVFITQQIGGENNRHLSELLIDDFSPSFEQHNLEKNYSLLNTAGFAITYSGEFYPKLQFSDIGAIVYFAKILEWEFPGFSVKRCFDILLGLQRSLEEQTFIESRGHRFYLVAKKLG